MARLACELYFRCENVKCAFYTNGALDEKECGLIFRTPTEYYPSYVHYAAVTFYKGSIDTRVKAAIKLGFFFEDEIEEKKWKSGKSFRMYREKIKSEKKVKKIIQLFPNNSIPLTIFNRINLFHNAKNWILLHFLIITPLK